MEALRSQACLYDPVLLHPDPNESYRTLASLTVTAAQACIMDLLLKTARMQYQKANLVEVGFGGYQPMFMTNLMSQ